MNKYFEKINLNGIFIYKTEDIKLNQYNMYTAINGVYENGQFTLQETPPTTKKSKVLIMFLEEITSNTSEEITKAKGVRLGVLANKGYNIPDDFNMPLDDLKDYM